MIIRYIITEIIILKIYIISKFNFTKNAEYPKAASFQGSTINKIDTAYRLIGPIKKSHCDKFAIKIILGLKRWTGLTIKVVDKFIPGHFIFTFIKPVD